MEFESKEFITKLGFEAYLRNFEEAYFNDIPSIVESAFQPDIISQIIHPLGHRTKFITKIKEYQQQQKEQYVESKITSDDLADSKEKASNLEEGDFEIHNLNAHPSSEEVVLEIQEDISHSELTSSGIITSTVEPTKPQEESSSAIIVENDVIQLLNLTAEGKLLIKLYQTKGFDNKSRIRLAACIICAEYGTDTNKVIPPHRFKQLAKQICEAFPDEDAESYYIPAYTPKGGKTVIAKGKLYDRYTCFNKELRDAKLREKRPHQDSGILPQDLIRITSDDNIEAYLKFLETCLEPWQSVVEYWERTSAHRINKLLTDDEPHANVESYFSKYGCLKQPKGYTLLEIDFNNRFPESKLRVFSHWKSFSSKVKKELSKLGLNEIESDADLIQKFVQLFSVSPVKVPEGKKAWRASRAEILQGLMFHINVMSDFQKEIERINSLAIQRGFTVQPFPLVVGENISNINSSYVVIDGMPILVESPLRALEVSFKCYFALNCEYPIQSQRQWIVLQKTLFNVHIPNDRVNKMANLPEVKRLIKLLAC